ncbi:NUDIX domain-containing protein [Streptomyces sp. sk226]|uniref:NUDIX domain-containing protein n=1 Tax=Streptomyces sp. sk226 TaxID=2034268 RepID=UPI000BF07671|nr:NUDIX domain-containing protein [Streptomyces sp. sk226]
MSGGKRHAEPVDVHLVLRRETCEGPEVLLSRRAGNVYAAGLWQMPSGHLDGPHEDIVAALVREAREETIVVIDPADVRAAVTVHHRSPAGACRTGYVFEVRRWAGTPRVAEPEVCDAMRWARLDALPEGMVAYCRAALEAYAAGTRIAVHFQQPGDAIAYDPAADRLHHLPEATGAAAGRPGSAVVEFAERAVGRITEWTDTSWVRTASRVWRASNSHGGAWYVKAHQNERFHSREVRALRTWVPTLGAAAPRLVAADPGLRAVVLSEVAGRPLHGAMLPDLQERQIFRRIGELARRIHDSAPPRPSPDGAGPALGKADRHLTAARSLLAPGDEAFVRDLVRRAEELPALEWVETHGDSGHRPSPGFGIAYGSALGDPELLERGRRTLSRLRSEHPPRSASGGLS